MAKRPNGYIIYEGPSLLDGSPIVVIATGFAKPSDSGKTGDMIQTWIIRADMSPVEAIKTGMDSAICAYCPQRPYLGGKCYVLVWQSPRSVYEAYKRGIYPHASGDELATLCAGRMIRIGSYGDPVAVPIAAFMPMLNKQVGWTGYTHQWRTCDLAWQPLLMASVETESDMYIAQAAGWRTFRTTDKPFMNIKGLEAVCGASKEKKRATTCAACKGCMGTSAKARVSETIALH